MFIYDMAKNNFFKLRCWNLTNTSKNNIPKSAAQIIGLVLLEKKNGLVLLERG